MEDKDKVEDALSSYKDDFYYEIPSHHDIGEMFECADYECYRNDCQLSSAMYVKEMPRDFGFSPDTLKDYPNFTGLGLSCDRNYMHFDSMDSLFANEICDYSWYDWVSGHDWFYKMPNLPSARTLHSSSRDAWHMINDMMDARKGPVRCVHYLHDLERVDWDEDVQYTRCLYTKDDLETCVCSRRESVGEKVVDILEARMREIRESGGELCEYRILFWYDQ